MSHLLQALRVRIWILLFATCAKYGIIRGKMDELNELDDLEYLVELSEEMRESDGPSTVDNQ